jgi:predicted negative regulator of RcsB-dependent stress response
MEAATKYEQLMKAYEAGDRAKSVALIDELQREYSSSPYADQAALMSARVHVDANELDAAAKSLQNVMDHSRDKQLQLVARLRLARVQLAQQKLDEALATLGAAQPGAFAPRFDEVRGDVLLVKGDKAGALQAYQKAKQAGEPGIIDNDLLDLKINDLMTAETQTPPAAKAQ